jgi:hypothetical protein
LGEGEGEGESIAKKEHILFFLMSY